MLEHGLDVNGGVIALLALGCHGLWLTQVEDLVERALVSQQTLLDEKLPGLAQESRRHR
jgi:hypothetical protein